MKVLFDHDGGVDDFVALCFLAASPEVELIGVCATPGDTYMEFSVPTTRAILDLAGLSHVPVAEGRLEGPNPFPDHFRIDGVKVWERTMLAGTDRRAIRTPLRPEPGHRYVAEALLAAPEPVVVVSTGPLTTLAAAMDEHPDVEDRILRLYWMGGAIDVEGNVDQPGHDGSAEWNVYADPAAAARVWDSNVDIHLCPLDATNSVPLTRELIDRLGSCGDSALATLAAQAYGSTDQTAYHLWDVLTCEWLVAPDLFGTETVPCEVVIEGEALGRTPRGIVGRAVTAALSCDGAAAYDLLVERLCAWRPGR